jgi:transposase
VGLAARGRPRRGSLQSSSGGCTAVTWLAAVAADDLPHLRSFAAGLRRDHAAVLNGLSLPYSSGAVEGRNCKIKFLKRLMFGRANLDLLRAMILHN